MSKVWILGATGRTGRAIAAALHRGGVELVLAGRDRDRVHGVADELGGAVSTAVGSLEDVLSQLPGDRPGVVVSTVGPFMRTAALVARACPAGTHYVDLSNELPAVQDVLCLDRQAATRSQTFVAGAGFGVLATESEVLAVCEGRPRPQRVPTPTCASCSPARQQQVGHKCAPGRTRTRRPPTTAARHGKPRNRDDGASHQCTRWGFRCGPCATTTRVGGRTWIGAEVGSCQASSQDVGTVVETRVAGRCPAWGIIAPGVCSPAAVWSLGRVGHGVEKTFQVPLARRGLGAGVDRDADAFDDRDW